VLGALRVWGEAGPPAHAGLAPDVADVADLLFACGPLMRNLYDAVPMPVRGAYAEDAASLAAIVARSVKPEDAILVKGSLGSRMKLVIAALDGLAEAR
jgi:UDP-N-acetylmuramoyl-tripeptide--D-alanyl-D-alanine ligase